MKKSAVHAAVSRAFDASVSPSNETSFSASVRDFDSLPDSAFVRLPTVCALFAIAPATAWRWSESGRLPRPKKIGERVSGWQVGELRAALQRIAA